VGGYRGSGAESLFGDFCRLSIKIPQSEAYLSLNFYFKNLFPFS